MWLIWTVCSLLLCGRRQLQSAWIHNGYNGFQGGWQPWQKQTNKNTIVHRNLSKHYLPICMPCMIENTVHQNTTFANGSYINSCLYAILVSAVHRIDYEVVNWGRFGKFLEHLRSFTSPSWQFLSSVKEQVTSFSKPLSTQIFCDL